MALVFVGGWLLIDVIPPRSLTSGRMCMTKRRIMQFAHQHNRLPATLAELPAMPGYDTETVDAWKRPLDYTIDESGVVTLRSLGADRQPGGKGDDRDLTGVFESRDAQGHWQDEMAPWKVEPLHPHT